MISQLALAMRGTLGVLFVATVLWVWIKFEMWKIDRAERKAEQLRLEHQRNLDCELDRLKREAPSNR
jgi:hypothetical protein